MLLGNQKNEMSILESVNESVVPKELETFWNFTVSSAGGLAKAKRPMNHRSSPFRLASNQLNERSSQVDEAGAERSALTIQSLVK